MKKKKSAIIAGINGQDGSFLTELLLDKGYKVYGMIKRNSISHNQSARINHLFDNKDLILEYGDLLDMSSIIRLIKLANPDEFYNLAAQSHVRISFDQPLYTLQATGMGVLNVLESIKLTNKNIKMYQASSSEMFGNNIDGDGYQRETTAMTPVSPYGCAKVFGYNICRNYRQSYNMFVSSGILFNHESTRRGENFVTNKVAKLAVEIYHGLRNKLPLGNLDASRDWSHAKDMVSAMHIMLQLDKPGDYVCASGESHTVRELCEVVFDYLNMDYKKYVTLDKRYLRPEELQSLKGDSTKFRKLTGWQPEISFKEMIEEMVEYWLTKYGEEYGIK